jgi:tyrosinase
MTISLGPIGKVLTDIPPNPRADGYGANPRCLRRDVNKYSSAQTYDNYTYALITKSGGDISKFQQDMLGIPEQNDWGVHMAGHYTIGGDPGGVSSHFSSNLLPSRSLLLSD